MDLIVSLGARILRRWFRTTLNIEREIMGNMMTKIEEACAVSPATGESAKLCVGKVIDVKSAIPERAC